MENAICIGGALDGKIVKAAEAPPGYSAHNIADGGNVVLNFYVADGLAINAAFHMVFAAYAKKGKK